MMNKQEHLLSTLAEEAAELAQRATKALRFGLDDIEEGQTLTARVRLAGELADLIAMVEMCGIPMPDNRDIEAKKIKVEKYLEYSRTVGTLA